MTAEQKPSLIQDAIRDVLAGTIAGLNTKVIEYPLDTVKVRLQGCRPGEYAGALDCIKKIAREDLGLFYRGLGAPVAGCMFENAVLFACYGRFQQIVRALFHEQGQHSREPLTIPQYALCGAGAGAVISFIMTPIELVKCRLQLQDSRPIAERIYRNSFHCACHILKVEGWRVLLGRGLFPTMGREVPGNACWYATYEAVRQRFATYTQLPKEEMPLYYSALAGSIAGTTYWTAFFPADVVKTRIQADPRFAHHTLQSGLRAVFLEGGFRSLYAGWGITIARAIPANAVLFVSYEWAQSALKKIM